MQRTRTLTSQLLKERQTYQKMIFLSGPRQVGKTTVFQQMIKKLPGPMFNWDNLDDRLMMSRNSSAMFENNQNIYFDEIHKAPRWKNFLKGNYDKYGDSCKIHVTGSARLDVYRRGGDSLLGRYILFRLHPFSVGEVLYPGKITEDLTIQEILEPDQSDLRQAQECWENLKKFGGFPESFLKQSVSFTRRWRTLRHERLVREDIRDMTRIRELAMLEQMIALLPERAAQPFSMNALREDLEVSHDSIRLWTKCLEEFYYIFFISPYSKRIARAAKKERKIYFWDYSELENPGAIFENMVASHLLKWSHLTRDMGHKEIAVHYIKNKEKQEVDFLITQDKKPFVLIEAKLDDKSPSRNAIKLSAKLGGIPVLQLVDQPGVLENRRIESINWTLMSASRFFKFI